MITFTDIQTVSREVLLNLIAQDEWVEIIDGEIVPMSPTGYRHGLIVMKVSHLLYAFVEENQLGDVLADGVIYVLRTSEHGIRDTRVPDVSFVRKGRLAEGFDTSEPFPGAPDLAIEIVSPSETAEILRDKIIDYLKAGSEQVWVMYPKTKEIHIYEGEYSNTVKIYGENDVFEAPTLFPSLKIAVKNCFA